MSNLRNVRITGVTSVGNSSEATLTNGSTFTGTTEQNDYPEVLVSLKTDQDGILYCEFSNDDGTNFDSSLSFEVIGGVNEIHRFVKGTRPFRVRFTNDSGQDQTYFRLHTSYGSFGPLTSPENLALSLDADALAVRPTSFQDEVRIGRRNGVTGWTKFGYRTGTTAAGGEESIWATTGNFTILTSASTFTVAYNSTTDGAGGSATGATQLAFYYIDSNGLPAVSTHTLGSSGSDVTSFSGLGINRIAVSASGSSKKNVNDITVTATTGSSKQAIVPAGKSVTQQAIFFTGSNHTGVLSYLFINVNKLSGSSPKATIKGYIYNRNVATQYEVFSHTIDTGTDTTVTLTDPIGFALSSTDVLYFVIDTDTNDTIVNIRFSLNEYQKT